MDPVQIGRIHKHIGASNAADNNIMKFYATQYSTSHGIDGFVPKNGKHTGTGYKSNFRPGVYYSRKLDELDNPEMGYIVSKNYASITHKDYQPSIQFNGKEPLPAISGVKSTGFGKDQHRTIPLDSEAHSIFPNLAMVGYTEKKPLLHSLNNKSPLDRENNNKGPAYFSTENHTQFTKKSQHIDTTEKDVGSKEMTGYTRSKNMDEPVTHYPESSYANDRNLKAVINPIGETETKKSFQPYVHENGKEKFKDLNLNANRNTGFTRFIQPTGAHTAVAGKVFTKLSDVNNPYAIERIKKKDPAEFTNMVHPSPFPSLSQTVYDNKPLQGMDINDQLGKLDLCKKENTGHTNNNQSYYKPPQDTDRFTTTYNQGFSQIPTSKNDQRLKNQSIQALQDDGYTKSEKLHKPLGEYDVGKQLNTLHPYVTRSLKARDPFYAENKYAHKQRSVLVD